MRIFRYLAREVLVTTFTILFVVVLIMMMSQAAVYLSKIAKGNLALSFLGKLMLINIPMLVSFILPFAFFLSILIAYGRFYAESEMVVLQASGFSNRRLFFYTCLIAVPVFILSAYLILDITPTIFRDKGEILRATTDNVLQTLVPGEFRSADDGNVVLYVSKANRDKTKLDNVFVAQFGNPNSAKTKNQLTVSYMDKVNKVILNGHEYLQAKNSYQYKGTPGNLAYTISHFKTYAGLMPAPKVQTDYSDVVSLPTLQLLHSHSSLRAVGELQWRLCLALQLVVLTIMAIPLSRINPRQGRYAKILPAIIFYFVFANMLFFARHLLEKGIVPPAIGLWWVFVGMLIFAIFYNAKVYQWWMRFKA